MQTKQDKTQTGAGAHDGREYFNINCCGMHISLFSSDEALTGRLIKHQVHVRSKNINGNE